MPTKRQRELRNAARAASIESFKKRRLEASSLSNLAQLHVDNNKLSTTDTSNEEAESRTWLWNESANETDSDSEEESSSDVDEEELEEEQSRTKQAVSPKLCKIEVKWSKEGEQNLRGGYGKDSKSSQMRRNRSIRELEKEGLKT